MFALSFLWFCTSFGVSPSFWSNFITTMIFILGVAMVALLCLLRSQPTLLFLLQSLKFLLFFYNLQVPLLHWLDMFFVLLWMFTSAMLWIRVLVCVVCLIDHSRRVFSEKMLLGWLRMVLGTRQRMSWAWFIWMMGCGQQNSSLFHIIS